MSDAGDYCCARCGRDHRPPSPGPTPCHVYRSSLMGEYLIGETGPGDSVVPVGTARAIYEATVVAPHVAREAALCVLGERERSRPRVRRRVARRVAAPPVRRLGPVCM